MKNNSTKLATVGYEGRSVEDFFSCISKNYINQIIDIRSNPISRKPGFSKKAFSILCEQHNISYIHFPDVGIPSIYRKQYLHKGISELLCYYESKLLPNARESIAAIITLISQRPSALLCFERNGHACHRFVVAQEIARQTGFSIVHL